MESTAGSTGTRSEIRISFSKVKVASTKLTTIASSLTNNRIDFTFSVSQGMTADKYIELIAKYNELGQTLADFVNETAKSVENLRTEFIAADQIVATAITSFDISNSTNTEK